MLYNPSVDSVPARDSVTGRTIFTAVVTDDDNRRVYECEHFHRTSTAAFNCAYRRSFTLNPATL